MKTLLSILALATFAFAAVPPAAAQTFPTKPIRIVVTFAPGGTADALARLIAKEMSTNLGQPVVVENRPGASGIIGADSLAKSPPDGYTVGVLSVSHAAMPAATKVPYDLQSLRPISLIASVPGLLSVHPSVPAKNLKELLALARNKPGQLAYSNAGNLTASHLAMETIKLQAGVDIMAVAYKGGGPALVDLVGGQVQMGISGPTAQLAFIKAGKLRPIATTALKRSTAAPDVPTLSESGMPGFELSDWYGLFAPHDTPSYIVAELNRQVLRALASSEMRAAFFNLGAEPGGNTPEQFAQFVANEIEKLGKLVVTLKIKVE